MAAPSTQVIRNFKGNFRAAVAGILATAGWTDVMLERSSARLKTSARKEITFDLGEALNLETLDTGIRVYDFFSARLRVRIVTARRSDQTHGSDEARDLHESFVADALDLLAEDKSPFTAELLPYYTVKTLRPLGTKSDLDVLAMEDFTDVEFALEFGIRRGAWPAGT